MTLTTSFPPCNLDAPLDVLTPLFLSFQATYNQLLFFQKNSDEAPDFGVLT